MRINLLLLLVSLFAQGLTAQDVISISYTSQQRLSKSVADAILATGYTPVTSVDAYTLSISGGTSTFSLDSIKFEELEETEFKQYLCWEKTTKHYNEKSFSHTTCAFDEGNCYVGKPNYVSEVSVDRSKTKKIMGFPCYAATYEVAGVTYQAWFTEDLPFPDGPFGLDLRNEMNIPLLPGLVLSLEDEATGSYFKAVDISVSQGPGGPAIPPACQEAKPIETYVKTDYTGMTQSRAIRLRGEDIIVNRWYAAGTKPGGSQ